MDEQPTPITPTIITLVEYSPELYHEKVVSDPVECLAPIPNRVIRWIDVEGTDPLAAVESLGGLVKLHPLAVEDICSPQRPKLDDYGNYVLIIFANIEQRQEELLAEQVSLIVASNLLITVHTSSIASIKQRRDRLRSGSGRSRSSGADYLAYSVMDGIVDHMTNLVEQVQENLEEFEEQLTKMDSKQSLHMIIEEKRQVLLLLKQLVPVVDVIAQLQRGHLSMFASTAPVYFRDLHDHGLHILDMIKNCRELVGSMTMVYHSMANNRLNEVMKVLTIVATTFAPITFITGYFGMNFHSLPLLDNPHGWMMATGAMVVTACGMLSFF
ncbi:MAG: magnesium/cobalt transporter CorA, partial [Chlamydiia bacterium]